MTTTLRTYNLIRHEPGPGTLDVELRVDQLRLADEMNPLGLTPGSLRVAKGDRVVEGQLLAQIGNSGNTAATPPTAAV